VSCPLETAVATLASGELASLEAAKVWTHAGECPDCRRALAAARAAEIEALVGTSIGRHRVVGVLGSGAMGVVLAAHDPQLDRRVALKLLRGETDAASRARLVREAQAMARLVHPSVVTVYDVGATEGGEVYLAMELVDGGTLRTWLDAERRTWRDVVGVFAAAGRGLAAAHAAGIVHRDFKPDNVLIGSDGRVRVTDFGLARAGGPVGADEPTLLDLDLTATGFFVGTPAYMSPEQFAALACDERSDQFSFCVALFEALWGRRPFPGDTARELANAVARGAMVDIPASDVPAHVRRAVVRGLAAAPDLRWPSMETLLAELSRDPARRRRRMLVGGAVAGALALAVLAAWDRGGSPCRDTAVGAWSAPRRSALEAAFVASGAEGQADAFARVATTLDGRAGSWRAVRRTVCEDTHVRGTASPALLDLRMACLASVDERTGALVAALGTADASAVAVAPEAAAQLPDAEACRDVQRLLELAPPPVDDRLLAVRARVAEAATARVLGRIAEASAFATDAATGAAEIGWHAMRAEALHIAAATAPEPARARALYRDALEAAELGRDDVQRADLWMALALAAADASQLDALDLYLAMGEAAARRSGDDAVLLRARRDRGMALASAGRLVEGEPIVRAACAETVEKLGASSAEALRCRRGQVRVAGFGDSADPREALALAADLEHAYGAWAPDRGDVLFIAAAAQTRAGDLDGAERSLGDALAIRRRAYGDDSAGVAQVLLSLGELHGRRGQLDRARAVLERALGIRERLYGVDSAQALVSHLMFASIDATAGATADALTRLQAHVPRFERALGGNIVELAYARQLEAELLVTAGRPGDALPLFTRAIAQSRTIYGAESPQVRALEAAAAAAKRAYLAGK
jgi:eukaryotic-like serine/threonine-protein kinase